MFRTEFVPLILAGEKTLTIRANRRLNENEKFSLRHWEGLPYRSKQIEFAQARAWIVEPVQISGTGVEALRGELDRKFIARRDGFPSWPAMRDFFTKTHGIPFDGWLHNWTALQPR